MDIIDGSYNSIIYIWKMLTIASGALVKEIKYSMNILKLV